VNLKQSLGESQRVMKKMGQLIQFDDHGHTSMAPYDPDEAYFDLQNLEQEIDKKLMAFSH